MGIDDTSHQAQRHQSTCQSSPIQLSKALPILTASQSSSPEPSRWTLATVWSIARSTHHFSVQWAAHRLLSSPALVLHTELDCQEHRSGHYGWYYRYLRTRRVSVDLRWPEATIATLHRLHPTRCWA